jgi:hypothetical protein
LPFKPNDWHRCLARDVVALGSCSSSASLPQQRRAAPRDRLYGRAFVPRAGDRASADSVSGRRLRLPVGLRARSRPWLHRPDPSPQRRARAQTNQVEMASAALGRRGLPLLAQPQPLLAGPLVEETREPPRAASARLRTDRVQESPRRTTRSRPTG